MKDLGWKRLPLTAFAVKTNSALCIYPLLPLPPLGEILWWYPRPIWSSDRKMPSILDNFRGLKISTVHATLAFEHSCLLLWYQAEFHCFPPGKRVLRSRRTLYSFFWQTDDVTLSSAIGWRLLWLVSGSLWYLLPGWIVFGSLISFELVKDLAGPLAWYASMTAPFWGLQCL